MCRAGTIPGGGDLESSGSITGDSEDARESIGGVRVTEGARHSAERPQDIVNWSERGPSGGNALSPDYTAIARDNALSLQ